MKVNEVIEHEDGSATLNVDFDEGEVQHLLNFAVVEILTQQIELEKERYNNDSERGSS